MITSIPSNVVPSWNRTALGPITFANLGREIILPVSKASMNWLLMEMGAITGSGASPKPNSLRSP